MKYPILLAHAILISILNSQTISNAAFVDSMRSQGSGGGAAFLGRYFERMNDGEAVNALTAVSSLGDENFIAYTLLGPLRGRIRNSPGMRNSISNKISEGSTPDAFSIVLIDYIDKLDMAGEERGRWDQSLFDVAKDQSRSNKLRGYAAGSIAKVSRGDQAKAQVQQLLTDPNSDVANGAALAAKGFILSNESYSDRAEWAYLLMQALENNRNNLMAVRGVVSVLGKTKTDEGKLYLFDLYSEYRSGDQRVSELVISALGQHIDGAMFKTLILETKNDRQSYSDRTGFDLVRKNLISNNLPHIQQLASAESIDEQLAFLEAIRLLRDKSNSGHVTRAIELLDSEDERVVIAAIQAIHFLLPHNEEISIYSRFTRSNSSENIMRVVESFIGYRG